jgi:predicted Fe-S protein YdhL (DUF1289 family)
MDPHTGWCDGCRRTLAEIAAWAGAADDYKRAVWSAIERRQPAALDPHPAAVAASKAPWNLQAVGLFPPAFPKKT